MSDDRCVRRAASALAIALPVACALLPAAVRAQQAAAARDVAIGLAAPPTSFDPHYHAHVPSLGLQLHVFEPLVFRDAALRLVPALAREWLPLADGSGWEFRLDPAARFSDGAPVTAADVAATFARLPNVPNSPGRVTHYAAGIIAVEAGAAPQVVRLRTAGPAPLVPENLTALMIVPERIARGAATADFAAGRAAIGSGPFRLREYVAGERVVVERNEAWWRGGQAVPWARVAFRVIAGDSARVAALRAGDVQLIEAVPARDAASLARDPALALARAPSLRLIYLSLDVARAPSPGVSDAEGRPLARNPLADRRVRRALSLALDREAIVGRLMEGQAVAAGQLQPDGLGVADPALRPDPYDPDAARRLLAEAGWSGGFRLTLAGPNDRYVNDEKILQAVAQYWERIGVRTRVEALPSAVFFGRSAAGAFSAQLGGWLTTSAEPANMVAALLLTPGRAPGWGVANRAGYSSAEVEALYTRAIAEPHRDLRLRHWREAVSAAMADAPILPLHHQVNIWATRRGLTYTPRPDEFTLAAGLRPDP
ncbi:ABC transporter substrate-binding protein [Caldovatus aquaticus]|uniref:ABC transporter substrate-binding protein n=1 Tax=Caldovatus aquaticus TaxID=2865671 RepID=A0ABS7F2V3_9PROT|nr:ABC transporter substrate-binding protein [Caldovatus aquaticus]MBW8269843.1 ABC transporter substrate-binding protein [Caldovatus aquaticus]